MCLRFFSLSFLILSLVYSFIIIRTSNVLVSDNGPCVCVRVCLRMMMVHVVLLVVCLCPPRWPLTPERLDYIRDVSHPRAAPALIESTYIEVRYEDKWIDAVLFRSWAHSCISCTITHEVRLCVCRLYHEYKPCRHRLFVKLFMKQKSHFCLFTKQKEGGKKRRRRGRSLDTCGGVVGHLRLVGRVRTSIPATAVQTVA